MRKEENTGILCGVMYIVLTFIYLIAGFECSILFGIVMICASIFDLIDRITELRNELKKIRKMVNKK